jgi:transposase
MTQNLGDALQRLLARQRAALHAAAQADDEGNSAETHDDRAHDESVAMVIPTPLPVLPDRLPTEREQRFQEVLTLHDQGWSSRRIAQTLQLNWRTVKRYVQARELPKRGAPSIQPISTLTPYLAYLEQRWQEGVQTGTVLWQELQQRGYTGSLSSVYRALEYLRPADGPGPAAAAASTGVSRRALSARQAMWVLVRADDELTEQERKARVTLETADPVIAAATSLAGRFLQLIRQRDALALDRWLGDAAASGVAELKRFASSLRKDYAAVRAALELPWSQGQIEGQINRLKVIKRVGYGRAKFELLRQRVLAAA